MTTATIDRLDVHAFTVPTDGPGGVEQDGTLTWDSTTMVLVQVHSGDEAAVLPRFHDEVPVYGSGGFTNYPLQRLTEQLGGWVARGIGRVKLKTGRQPAADPGRLTAVRDTIGDDAELFVDPARR
jgi:hypothetical protein